MLKWDFLVQNRVIEDYGLYAIVDSPLIPSQPGYQRWQPIPRRGYNPVSRYWYVLEYVHTNLLHLLFVQIPSGWFGCWITVFSIYLVFFSQLVANFSPSAHQKQFLFLYIGSALRYDDRETRSSHQPSICHFAIISSFNTTAPAVTIALFFFDPSAGIILRSLSLHSRWGSCYRQCGWRGSNPRPERTVSVPSRSSHRSRW